jgi:hypothetical protein
MIKLRFATVATLGLAATVALWAVLSRNPFARSKPPITLRYVTTGQFNDGGYLSFGTTFWATNHTTNEYLISMAAIEVKVGTNWSTRLIPNEILMFRPTGEPLPRYGLPPHVAGYVTPAFSAWPTSGTWRLRVFASEKLTGMTATATGLWRYPGLMKRRFLTKDPNIPVNPFATNMVSYKNAVEVVSQEVSEE